MKTKLTDESNPDLAHSQIIGKLEEGRSVTRVWLQSSELLKASFHDFGDDFKLQEQLSGGSVVVVHEEPHPQMTGTLSYRPEETGGRQREKLLDRQTTQATGRPILRFTVARRLHGGGLLHNALYALTPAHRRKRSRGAGNTGIRETMNGDEYFYR
ncbi:hypothetical protein TNCV_5017841 [Trichonephila clavipes]|nr:hypothetical protein TNCV_5017841 [Trichonephila clavipes]